MDKFFKKISKNNLIFFTIIFLVALIAGSIFSIIINSGDKLLVTEHLNNYFNNLDKINYYNEFKSNIILNYIYITLIWILGFGILGIPILILFYFLKSFILGFVLGSIILNYKFKGVILGILYLIPSNIINMIIYTILIINALNLSLKLLNSIIFKKTIDFKQYVSKYTKLFFVIIILITISNAYEVFLLPKIFNIFI